MVILETHAKNEQEALELAGKYLGIEIEKIDVKLHQKGATGFLGFGTKTPSVYHIEAIEDKTPVEIVVKGVIATLLHKMGYKARFLSFEKREDGKLYIEIASPHAGYIIGKRGKTLESLQFLVNLMVEKFTKEQPKILLDLENYRARRASHLEELAKKTADFVARTGKSRLLDPLNPYERRLIHVALQEDDRVETESEGNGVYKRLRVTSVKPPENSSSEAGEMYEDDQNGEEHFDKENDHSSAQEDFAQSMLDDTDNNDESATEEDKITAGDLEENQNQ